MNKARVYIYSDNQVNNFSSGYVDVLVDDQGRLLISGATSNVNNTSDPSRHTVNSGSAVNVLPANAARAGFSIQNVGTTVLKVCLGPVDPDQNTFHFSLPAGGNANDGSSPRYESFVWAGDVRIISSVDGGAVVVVEYT